MNKVFLIFTLLLSTLTLNAQTTTANRRWFVGAQAGCNYAVADNITDHSAVKYLSDAIGPSCAIYAGTLDLDEISIRLRKEGL